MSLNQPLYGGVSGKLFDSLIRLSGYVDMKTDLKKVSPSRYICTIQDTKPKVCKEFFCEWAYGISEKGIPFKRQNGWTEKSRQLGYRKTKKQIVEKSH